MNMSNRNDSTSNQLVGSTDRVPVLWSVIIVLGALLMAVGAVIALLHPAMLVSPHDEINGAVHIYAGYFASRNAALAMMLLALLVLRARVPLGNLMVLVALIQFIDAFIDCFEGRWNIVPGVLIFGIVFAVGAARLTAHPFWKREAWVLSR
jgi:hypothetical protein